MKKELEHAIQNKIRNELAGKIIFRANVGVAWTGRTTKLDRSTMLIENPRRFSSGLPPGFSDLFGIQDIEITPEMVGKKIGVFVAIEVKAEGGRVSEEQKNFLRAVRKAGGFAGVARSPEDAKRIMSGVCDEL